MSQISTTLSQMQAQNSGNLLSQPKINPRNVSTITLQSGKQLEKIPPPKHRKKGEAKEAVPRKLIVDCNDIDPSASMYQKTTFKVKSY